MSDHDDNDKTKRVVRLTLEIGPDPAEVERLRAVLAGASPAALAAAMFVELDRRRLDAAGNPTELPGLYSAVCHGFAAIVEGAPPAGPELTLVEHVAAVGRGVPIQAETDATDIRRIAELTDAMIKSTNIPEANKARSLALTFAIWFGRPVDEAAIASALSNPNRNGRTTDIAIAAGVLDASEGRQKVLDRVRHALG